MGGCMSTSTTKTPAWELWSLLSLDGDARQSNIRRRTCSRKLVRTSSDVRIRKRCIFCQVLVSVLLAVHEGKRAEQLLHDITDLREKSPDTLWWRLEPSENYFLAEASSQRYLKICNSSHPLMKLGKYEKYEIVQDKEWDVWCGSVLNLLVAIFKPKQ